MVYPRRFLIGHAVVVGGGKIRTIQRHLGDRGLLFSVGFVILRGPVERHRSTRDVRLCGERCLHHCAVAFGQGERVGAFTGSVNGACRHSEFLGEATCQCLAVGCGLGHHNVCGGGVVSVTGCCRQRYRGAALRSCDGAAGRCHDLDGVDSSRRHGLRSRAGQVALAVGQCLGSRIEHEVRAIIDIVLIGCRRAGRQQAGHGRRRAGVGCEEIARARSSFEQHASHGGNVAQRGGCHGSCFIECHGVCRQAGRQCPVVVAVVIPR